jgi:LysM repeat protein
MKLRRFQPLRVETTERNKKEQQRSCPQCGSLISVHAKTCVHCGADLEAIAAQERLIEREQREEAAQRPVRAIAIVITGVIVLAILALIIQGSREAALLALTPTVTPTPTRTATPTVTPTPSPTSAATPTPIPPVEYTVKSGDTPFDICAIYGCTPEDLMAFNNKGPNDFIVVGEKLLIPIPTPVPTDTPTPEGFVATPTSAAPTPSEVIYIVKDGDTLIGIARDLGVPMDVIQRRNNISDPENIQIGQQLVVPVGPTPTFTPLPAPAGVTSTPIPTYGPVQLLSPLDGEIVVGNSAPILLEWLSSGILRDNELYKVEVSQVGGTRQPASIRTLSTGWHLPTDLFPPATDRNRTFRWSVVIIRQVGTGTDGAPIYDIVSPVSERTFDWVATPPTVIPTPTPFSSLSPTP